MKKRKGFLSILVILVDVVLCWQPAFSDWADSWQDMRNAFSKVKSIKTDFVQEKKMRILARPIVSKGRFFYRAPGDLRWEYDSPIRSVMLLHEGDVERFTWREGKYSRDAGGSLEGLRFVLQDISGWLAGDFVSSTTFTAELKPGSPVKIVLSPREKSFTEFIQRVELTLASTPGVLRSVEIVESQENATHIEFQNVEINLQFGEGLFTDVQ
jgi:outer membrane lipoprotein-sorting protein